jgi:hypothetical protein
MLVPSSGLISQYHAYMLKCRRMLGESGQTPLIIIRCLTIIIEWLQAGHIELVLGQCMWNSSSRDGLYIHTPLAGWQLYSVISINCNRTLRFDY